MPTGDSGGLTSRSFTMLIKLVKILQDLAESEPVLNIKKKGEQTYLNLSYVGAFSDAIDVVMRCKHA